MIFAELDHLVDKADAILISREKREVVNDSIDYEFVHLLSQDIHDRAKDVVTLGVKGKHLDMIPYRLEHYFLFVILVDHLN